MPAGQTPHTVTLYAHHDLVDAVQPGDRCVSVCVCVRMCMHVCMRMFGCIYLYPRLTLLITTHMKQSIFMTHTCHKCNGYMHMVLMTK